MSVWAQSEPGPGEIRFLEWMVEWASETISREPDEFDDDDDAALSFWEDLAKRMQS